MQTLKTLTACTALALTFTLANAADAPKAEVPQKGMVPATAPAMPSQEEMMKKMEAAGAVTENHKALEYLVGDWNAKAKMWMEPTSKPQESMAKAKFEKMWDGRVVKQTYEGDMMGKPFTGVGFMGYDNMKKKYFSTWMDSMSTALMTMEGDSPDKGKTIKTSGMTMCPMTDKEMPMRSVMKKVGKNEMHFEMYMNAPDGKEFKTMEIVYKR